MGDLALCLPAEVASADVGSVQGKTEDLVRFLAIAKSDARRQEPRAKRYGADAQIARKTLEAFAGLVALDAIVQIERRTFSGHVYNLQTKLGWYACNSIITHNCRHNLGIYIEGLTRPMKDTADPVGYAERQQQRHNERMIRRWKNRSAVAITDQAKQKAASKVQFWQATQRDFIARTGRRRDYGRESVTRAR
jgi:hypothetical protein